jgi:DNA adenine methylase
MREHDGADVLHFVDPPYVSETRVQTKAYRHELTNEQHAQLCDVLAGLTGMVVLCGYHNDIYARLGWRTIEREFYSDGHTDRTEVLWLNPAADAAQNQGKLL